MSLEDLEAQRLARLKSFAFDGSSIRRYLDEANIDYMRRYLRRVQPAEPLVTPDVAAYLAAWFAQ